MKKLLKRIQLIHRTNDGKCRKFWQNIDFNKMITLEHVWNDLKQQLVLVSSNKKFKFYYYKTKKLLPEWFHVNLLNDNDQILIDEVYESSNSNKPIIPLPTVETAKNYKIMSKQKQLKTSLTNRSFLITNKHSIPDSFYEHWEEGITHKKTYNAQMIF